MKNTCLFYALKESRLLRKYGIHHQLKLFFGFSRDSLALHMYIYDSEHDLSVSFCPLSSNRSKRKDNFIFALYRVLRYFFPFTGYVNTKSGDYYSPKFYSSDFYCKSIVLRSF